MFNNINILGIDPGLNTGLSVLSVNSNTLNIDNIISINLNLNNHENNFNNKTLDKCYYLKKNLISILNYYNINIIGYETPFINIKYMNNYMILSNYIYVIESTSKEFNNNLAIFKFSPKEIKSSFVEDKGGNADKKDMKKQIASIPEITDYIDYNLITEHEIDAIAVAYVILKKIRYNKDILLFI